MNIEKSKLNDYFEEGINFEEDIFTDNKPNENSEYVKGKKIEDTSRRKSINLDEANIETSITDTLRIDLVNYFFNIFYVIFSFRQVVLKMSQNLFMKDFYKKNP